MQLDNPKAIKAVKIENKNQTDLNLVIGNMFQKYCQNNKQIEKLAANKIFDKMRLINEDRKHMGNEMDNLNLDVQDLMSVKSDSKYNKSTIKDKDRDSLVQTKASFVKTPKPVTLNEILTNSVNKLTLNPFVKTLVNTNEFNSKSCTNLKQINKDLKLKKEIVDQYFIHQNTDQLNMNKEMIETNAELKNKNKNPGGKQRNPKLDQSSRFATGLQQKVINNQISPLRQTTQEEFDINEEGERKSRERVNRKIKDSYKNDAFVYENLNNKKFTEN